MTVYFFSSHNFSYPSPLRHITPWIQLLPSYRHYISFVPNPPPSSHHTFQRCPHFIAIFNYVYHCATPVSHTRKSFPLCFYTVYFLSLANGELIGLLMYLFANSKISQSLLTTNDYDCLRRMSKTSIYTAVFTILSTPSYSSMSVHLQWARADSFENEMSNNWMTTVCK